MDHMSTLSTNQGGGESKTSGLGSDGIVEKWIYSSKNYLQGEDSLTRHGNVYSVTDASVRKNNLMHVSASQVHY